MGESRYWKLRIEGGIELHSPDGEPTKLAYRKVNELIKLLALNQPSLVDREELGETLWPESTFQQRQINLRQAVYRLRQVIGHEMVVTTSKGFGLSGTFLLECERPTLRAEDPPKRILDESPISGFVQVLRWLAERDPAQMLEIMRSNVDLSLGIWPTDMHDLFCRISDHQRISSRLAAWIPFWQGYAQHVSDSVGSSRRLFGRAAEMALVGGDYELLAETLIWLGCSEVLRGRMAAADRVLERATSLFARLNKPRELSRLNHLRGTVLIHQAKTHEGLRVLEEAGRNNGERLLDVAQNQALRAFYMACVGDCKAALRTLESPIQIAEETRHFRLESICELALGHIAIAEGNRDDALNRLGRVVRKSAAVRETHFEIYAREATAVTLWQTGYRGEALEEIDNTKLLRNALHMAYTKWDQIRLRPIIECA